MNSPFKSKAFYQLILLHSKNPGRTKELLGKDQRLSRDERNIVRGFLMMRDNLNEEALTLASAIKEQSDYFVESMRLYLLGSILNNLGLYSEALPCFQKAYALLPKQVDVHLEFVILCNIYVIYSNLNQISGMRESLAVMQMMNDLPENDLNRLKRFQFGFEISVENFEKASALYEFLQAEKELLPPFDLAPLLNQFYQYGIVFNLLDVSENALNDLKKIKKYVLTGIFNHMKMMLAHLKDQKPLYFNDEQIKGHRSNLLELKFIRALDQSKISELKPIWKELQKINPISFRDHFQYTGFKSAFSRCLELHQHKLEGAGVHVTKESNLSILDALEELIRSGRVMTKEQLFYYAYGREIESKDDLNRISRRIYQLKTLRGLEIQSVRGAYQLLKKTS